MGLTQSVSASEVAQRTQVSIEEAEELLAAFTKHGGTGTHIGLDTFKQVLRDTQHLYDSPAFSPKLPTSTSRSSILPMTVSVRGPPQGQDLVLNH